MTTTFDNHKDLAYSAVITPPSPATSGTSLTVTTGDGAKFPAAPFNCTVWPGGGATASQSNAEEVRVTGIATDTLTIVRGQGGTTAQSIAAGYLIALTGMSKILTDIEGAINATLGGSLSGTLPNPIIAAGVVGTTQLAAGAVTQRLGVAGSTSGPTTTSTTAVVLTDMTQAITTTGGDLEVFLTAQISNSSSGVGVNIGIQVASVGTSPSTATATIPVAGASVALCAIARFTGLAAGAYTVNGLWWTSAGTATAVGTNRQMLTKEIRR